MYSVRKEVFEDFWVPAGEDLVILGSDSAKEKFSQFEAHLLPFLPNGYRWHKQENGEYTAHKHSLASQHMLKLFLYGPNHDGKISYNLIDDGKNLQSFTSTQKKTFGSARRYPMNPKVDYKAIGFAYAKATAYHTPGHCVDHADTPFMIPATPEVPYATHHDLNYIPEPPSSYWGLHIRNPIVADIRRHGGSYMQYVKYEEVTLKTADGTTVPQGVYFFDINAGNKLNKSYHINWTDETNYFANDAYRFKGKGYLPIFNTDISFAPVVSLYQGLTTKTQLDELGALTTTMAKLDLGNGVITRQRSKLLSRDPERDRLNVLQKGSELDFRGVEFETDLALQADKLKFKKLRNRMIYRSIVHAEKILELDDSTESDYDYDEDSDTASNSVTSSSADSSASSIVSPYLYTEPQRASLLTMFARPNIRSEELEPHFDSESFRDRFDKINKDQDEVIKPSI